jgi:GT2 family glycosyltransferase
MPDFSIICCISQPEVFDKCLLKSIYETKGKFDVEIIPIFNYENRYSASNALNIGMDVARSDTLIFAHQDIRLLHDWFNILHNCIDKLPYEWAILGSAGINLKYGRSDIGRWGGALHADTVAVGSVWYDDDTDSEPQWNGIKELATTHCVDECLMVVNKRSGLRFDAMFHGFHFYAVDLCLQARSAAYSVFCTHLPIVHYGKYSASMVGDNKYWPHLRFLYHKWAMRFPELLGTHMHWSNNELTSYIPMSLASNDAQEIKLKSVGVSKVVLSVDRQHGLLNTHGLNVR